MAAPKPQSIVELDAIKALLAADQVVIAGGGGGIPVMEQGIELKGASAVIEKDLLCGKLAELINADDLLIITGVEKVSLNMDTEHETYLENISVDEARRYMEEGHFAPGSMLPKFQAGVSFVENGKDRRAIITDLPHTKAGYLGKTGTIIQ